jgi:hypothetical protein
LKVLVDHGIEGYAILLWGVMAAEGLLELAEAELVTFRQIGLPIKTPDREVWRFVQANGMILLTNNRNMDGPDSLELTMREEIAFNSLPVLTIGRIDRLDDKVYRARCAGRLAEILMEIEKYLGTTRIFIP